jgi:hypothetical protein
LAKPSARQRSNVATLIPTSRDTKSIAELSGGNSLATIRSLYLNPAVGLIGAYSFEAFYNPR